MTPTISRNGRVGRRPAPGCYHLEVHHASPTRFRPRRHLLARLILGASGLVAVQARADEAVAQCPESTDVFLGIKFKGCAKNACMTIGGGTSSCKKFRVYEKDRRGRLRKTNQFNCDC